MPLPNVPPTETDREFPFSVEDFRYLASLVYDRSGIVLGTHKMDMVYARLARRLRELQIASFQQYCELVQSRDGTDEVGVLINAITTNLTKFFRESHHFDHLRGLLQDLAARDQVRRLRIWSAGCSSGEEPYSIAITLAESVPGLARWDARILATDLDTSMVAKGKTGVYPLSALAEMPKAIRAKYFRPDRGARNAQGVVADSLRQSIAFKQLNLMGPWPIKGPFDAIFCRNVMIYFDAATKAQLVSRFARLIKPSGWLYIGHSESLLDRQSMFRLQGRTIYQKIAP